MHLIDHPISKNNFSYWEIAIADAVQQLFEYSDKNAILYKKTQDRVFYFLEDSSLYLNISNNNLDNLKNLLDLYIDSKIYLNQNSDRDVYSLHKKFIFLLSSFSIAVAKDIALDNGDFEYFKVNLIDTLIRKQKDYGPKNISKFGITGLAIRMYDKISRLTNLTSNGNKPMVVDEPLLDTALDLVGYCSIAIMWLDGNFLLPMQNRN